jgi:mannose-1-phosphate guanylyltransferase
MPEISSDFPNKIRVMLLAAGLGTRLAPLTQVLPKCLMPVQGHPAIAYWLHSLETAGVESVLVNTYHHAEMVRAFLAQDHYRDWVKVVLEPDLLGTGGPLLQNRDFFRNCTTMLVHADNLCFCDFHSFIHFHRNERPTDTAMTMMTFNSPNPQACGIAELNEKGVVVGFHEKVVDPPGDLASAAVFLMEEEVLERLPALGKAEFDFSADIIPSLIGRIATWHNRSYLRDIGTLQSIKSVQDEDIPSLPERDTPWYRQFREHPIHNSIQNL